MTYTDDQITVACRAEFLRWLSTDDHAARTTVIDSVSINDRTTDTWEASIKWHPTDDPDADVDDALFTVTVVDGQLDVHGPEW